MTVLKSSKSLEKKSTTSQNTSNFIESKDFNKKREIQRKRKVKFSSLPLSEHSNEDDSNSDNAKPDEVLLSVGKKKAQDQRQQELQMKKLFIQDKKARARKIFRSEKIGRLSENELEKIDFSELEKRNTKVNSFSRPGRKKGPPSQMQTRRVFGNIEVRTINEPSRLCISPKSLSILNSHISHIDRSDRFSVRSGKTQPAFSFITNPKNKRKRQKFY